MKIFSPPLFLKNHFGQQGTGEGNFFQVGGLQTKRG